VTDIFTAAFIATFIAGVIASAIPLVLGSLGETLGEQSGVLNLGIEGMMLFGAYFGFITTLETGSYALGLLAGSLSGVVMAVLMVLLNILLGLNQIVIGLALTMFGGGITSVLYFANYGQTTPRLGQTDSFSIPGLADIPVVGASIFQQPIAFWIVLLLAVVVSVVLRQTNFGLRVRAAGQNPNSLDAAGGNVVRTRTYSALLGGAFSGFGGAYLALMSAGTFTPFMTAGIGYIAIVVTMLSRGRILWVIVSSFVYGLSVSVGTVLQLTSIDLPTDVIKMLPFVAVMITLVVFARSSYVPPALGVPYTRGAR
jgi:simple sugar transport system permease protein